jgi:hypothetical protein
LAEADEKKQSTIIGYGPIAGDLVQPSSTVVHDGKLYVLDQTGISVFDLETKKLIDKHLASYQKDVLFNLEKVHDLYSYHYRLSRSMPINYSPIGESLYSSIYTNQQYYVQPAMCLDSKQNLYIASQEGVHVLTIESMTPKTVLSYPKEIVEQEKDTDINIVTMKLYNDQLFLLKTVYYIYEGQLSNTFYQLDLKGNILNTFEVLFDEENYSDIVEPDFIYIKEYDLFGMTYTIHDYWEKEENPNPHPILWYNSKGERIHIANPEGFPSFFSRIEYNPANQNIVLTGRDYDLENTINAHFTLFSMHLERDHLDYRLVLNFADQKKDFGQNCMDITSYDDDTILISLGQFYETWNYRVYRVTGSTIDQYGTAPNRPGQIYNSMSFCIDTQGTLYTHNNSQIFLNLFAPEGTCKDTLDLDYELITMKWWNIANSTILSDLSLQGDNLVFVNALPNTVTEYSLLDETWNQLYKGDITNPWFWSNIQYQDGQYLVLFPRYWVEDYPHVYKVADVMFMEYIKDFRVIDQEYKVSPIFVGFNIITVQHENECYPQYQFLDCVHQTIWIYDHRKKLQEIVQLPQNENSFYSSFDLYPDGSWIVTDVTQHRLLHISRTGELIETIGSKGRVEIGTTQEAYLEKPDQFYFPLRAKIANNHIYVADFGNCRYHKIPIEPLSIQWKDNAIHHEHVSIFSSESGIVEYDVSIPSTATYEVTSTVPWLVIRHQYGSLQDKQIYYHILAKQLSPWETHVGEIHVTFPQKWSFLNHSIPVSVSTIGSTVELTIGSDQAKVDGKPVALEEGYIPVMKDNRTCIGIRFLTDYLFRSHFCNLFIDNTAALSYKLDGSKVDKASKEKFS